MERAEWMRCLGVAIEQAWLRSDRSAGILAGGDYTHRIMKSLYTFHHHSSDLQVEVRPYRMSAAQRWEMCMHV